MNKFIQAGIVVAALMAVVYLGGNYIVTGSALVNKDKKSIENDIMVAEEKPAITPKPAYTAVVKPTKVLEKPKEIKVVEKVDPITAGKKVFRKCKACHTVKQGGKNKIGPNLWAIANRPIANISDFKYSDALISKKGTFTWSEDNLDKYLTKPKDFIPGNKMAFSGVKKDADRKALIQYLKTMQ